MEIGENLEFIDVLWVNQGFTLMGIVKYKDLTMDQVKFTVGVGLTGDEKEDVKRIVEMGQKIDPVIIINFLKK